jgi:hypothetical protein
MVVQEDCEQDREGFALSEELEIDESAEAKVAELEREARDKLALAAYEAGEPTDAAREGERDG